MGRWDLYLKTLVWESPQDFVSWLLPGTRYIRRREGQMQTQELPEGSFPMREIRSDSMIEAEYQDRRLLIQIEFQSTRDEEIGQRLLGYSYEATRLYKLPVLSCVIYPRYVSDPPSSPYKQNVPGRGDALTFSYDSIELAKMTLADLEQRQLIGLAPLFLCVKDGATREVLERAITQLEVARKVEALAILHLIATLVFEKRPADLRWTEWRFERMQDFLLENSIMYQKLVKLGELKGIEEGIEKGIETGRVEGKRESIESIVQMRFPALLDLAKERLKYIQDQESLQRLLVAMVAANTERQARRFLLALRDKSKE